MFIYDIDQMRKLFLKKGGVASLQVYFAELVPQVQLGPQMQIVQPQFDLSLFV